MQGGICFFVPLKISLCAVPKIKSACNAFCVPYTVSTGTDSSFYVAAILCIKFRLVNINGHFVRPLSAVQEHNHNKCAGDHAAHVPDCSPLGKVESNHRLILLILRDVAQHLNFCRDGIINLPVIWAPTSIVLLSIVAQCLAFYLTGKAF